MVNAFNGHEYTQTSVLEELLLIERHARDGSAVEAGCGCIEEKHLLTLSGLSSEMPTLTKSDKEKDFYARLAETARELRKMVIDADFPSFELHINKSESGHSVKCEAKVQKCIQEGGTEDACRMELGCYA